MKSVKDQIKNRAQHQVWIQVASYIEDQILDRVWNHVGYQVASHVASRVGDQLWDNINNINRRSLFGKSLNWGVLRESRNPLQGI